MASLLSGLTDHDNLTAGLHKDQCKDCKSCLKCVNVKDSSLISKCVDCNKFLKLTSMKTYQKICKHVQTLWWRHLQISLVLRNGVYPNEYMNS